MPTYYPIQTNFAGGIISPRLQGGVDRKEYEYSLNSCTNFNLTPLGGLAKRSGFQYLGDAQSTDSRLVTYPRSNESDYIVEIAPMPGMIRVWDGNGRVTQGADNLINDSTFQNGLNDWTATGEPFEPGNLIQIVPVPNIGVEVEASTGVITDTRGRVAQLIRIPAAGTYTFSCNSVVVDTVGLEPDTEGLVRGGRARVQITSTDGSTIIAEQMREWGRAGGGQPPEYAYPAVGTVLNWTFTHTFADATDVMFRISCAANAAEQQAGALGNLIRQRFTNIRGVNDAGVETPIQFPSVYTAAQIPLIQIANDTASRALILAHNDVRPQRLQEVSGNLVFGDAPITGQPGGWSDNNWPAVVEFFQGRLLFAATVDEPGTIWGSEVGSIYEFGQVTDPVANSPYVFTLLTNGTIQFMRGTKVLYIGTDRDEWTGFGSNGIITTTDFQFQRQSELGNSRVQAEFAGDQLISVSTDGQRIRAVNFDGINTETYTNYEISLPAENLFNQDVRRIAYVRDPFYQLFCITTGGELRICMHDRVTQLTGWYTYETQGVSRSITASQQAEGDALFTITNRGNTPRIEIYRPNTSAPQFLDQWMLAEVVAAPNGGDYSNAHDAAYDITNTGRVRANISTNIWGSRNVSCYIRKADGRIFQHRDLRLADNSTFLLDETVAALGDMVVVGLSYSATAETLPMNRTTADGTWQGRLLRFNRIFARIVNNSGIPTLNGRLGRVRNAPAAPQFITHNGDVEIRDIGQRKQGVVTITQSEPLPTEVVALFGKLRIQVT